MSASDDTMAWLAGCRRRAAEFYRLTNPTAAGQGSAAAACGAAYDSAGDVPAILNHIDDLDKAIDRLVGGQS